MIRIRCARCGKNTSKPAGEVVRSHKLSRPLFCGRSCSAKASNDRRRSKQIVMTCPCGKRFKTTTHNKAKRHCNRSCASKYSMTEERRAAQRKAGIRHKGNLSPSACLKSREAWKYVALEKILSHHGRRYEFEYGLSGRVFDLALLDSKVLIEFDGPDHGASNVKADDKKKEAIAEAAGFVVVRRPAIPCTVIDPETIEGL